MGIVEINKRGVLSHREILRPIFSLFGEMGVRVEGVILSPAVFAKEATEALPGPALPFVFYLDTRFLV